MKRAPLPKFYGGDFGSSLRAEIDLFSLPTRLACTDYGYFGE
jgi:hypothetical protein